MPGRRIVLAAALAGWMLGPALYPRRADALDGHILIFRCAAAAGANLQGMAALRKTCPGIDQAVASLGISSLLPAGWDKKASGEKLGDLAALTARYAGQPLSALPSASDLRTIALKLRQPQSPPSSPSLWDHFKAWLRLRLAPLAGLLKWWRALPGGTAGSGLQGLLLVTTGVLIFLGVAAIIVLELRAAGAWGRWRRSRSDSRRRSGRMRSIATDGAIGGDADLACALEQPASALRMLIEALRRSRRIERVGNLTCREVLDRAVFDTQAQREGFASIALLAERELFGPRGSPVRVPDELRPTLQALYTQLLAVPAARPAAS